jgi:hypothetical protein
MYQMAIKYSNIVTRPSKIYPNRDFWSENIPSGNPAYIHTYIHTYVKKVYVTVAMP